MNSLRSIYTVTLYLLFSLIVTGCANSDSRHRCAVNGVADLRNSKLYGTITRLDGEWEFYPGRLISPIDFDGIISGKRNYLKVPGDWNRVQGAKGYGTYRLKVILPESYPPLSLKMLWIKSVSKVWIDDRLLLQQGVLPANPSDSLPGDQIAIADFRPENSSFDITIQVANYNDRRGGICFPVYMALPVCMYKNEMKITFVFTFIIGAIAIVMLFHFALFYYLRALSLNLYMTLVCFLAIVRLFLLGDSMYIYSLISQVSYNILVKIEFIGLVLIFLFLLEYFTKLYMPDYRMRIKQVLRIFIASLTVYLLVAPVYYVRSSLPLIHIYILMVTLYLIAWPLFRGYKEKKRGAKIYMAIAIVSLPALVNDIRYFLTSTGLPNISGYFFLLFFAGHFVVVSLYFVDLISRNISLLRDIRLKNEIVANLNLLSATDPLTGLFNRRFFDNYLNSRITNFKKGDIFWLVLFDIDHFKKVNDNFGHNKGDAVLKDMAEVVRKLIRTEDVFCRWGGEEFAIMISGMEKHVIEQFSGRIRESIATYSFPVETTVTASFGITSYITGESPADFVNRCDTALYEAKNGGRNRVVFHE